MKLITTTELAESWDVSPARVRQWIAEERIKPAATLPSGQHLFRPSTKRPTPQARGPKPQK